MSPLILLIGSLGFSLAFNISWAWGGPVLSIVAAAACTLIVPAGLHLWPMVPAHSWQVRWLRAIVMTGICAAAAYTSFSHAVSVLLSAGWTQWAAWSVTGGAELLVALSTMAVRAPVQARTEDAVHNVQGDAYSVVPTGVPTGVPSAVQPVPTVRTEPVQASRTDEQDDVQPVRAEQNGTNGARRLSAVQDPERLDDLRQWAAKLGETPSAYKVRQRYGCGQAVADRLLKELKEIDGDRDEDREAVAVS